MIAKIQDRKGLVVSEEQTKANVGKKDRREAGGTNVTWV